MKKFRVVLLSAGMILVLAGTAQAKGKWVTRTAVDGRQVQVQLDGKYSTCMRDAQHALGHDFASSKRFCDSRNLKH